LEIYFLAVKLLPQLHRWAKRLG